MNTTNGTFTIVPLSSSSSLFGTGSIDLAGQLQSTGTATVITVGNSGSGTLYLTNLVGAASNLAGTLNVNSSTVDITSYNGSPGKLATVTTYNLIQGGVLEVDNSTTNITGRLDGTTSSITLNGGELLYNGISAGISSDTFGSITLASGYSTVELVQNGTGGTTLTVPSMVRTAGATALFTGGATGSVFGTTTAGRPTN